MEVPSGVAQRMRAHHTEYLALPRRLIYAGW